MAPIGAARAGIFGGGSAILDSVVYRWVTPIDGLSDGATGFSWPADIGVPSIAAQNGLSYSTNALDGQFDAVSGDGSDDYGDTNSQLPDWTTDFVSSDRAFVFEFRSSSFNARDAFFGFFDDGGTGSLLTIRPDNGEVQIRIIDDDSNEVIYETSAGPFDDGAYHALALNKIGSDPTNWEWYDVAGDTATQLSDNVVTNTTLTSINPIDHYLLARNSGGSPTNQQSADIGQILLADAALSDTELDNAPFR